MHFMYQDLTGDISQTEEPQVLLDLRKLNENPKSTKFDEFWEEFSILFNEYQTAVQERRHGDIAYLLFVISIRN